MGYVTAIYQLDVSPGKPPIRVRLTPNPVALDEIRGEARRGSRNRVEGTVTESGTGKPVAGAVVWSLGSRGRAVAGKDGHYLYQRARSGSEQVRVDVLGYYPRYIDIPVSESWQRLDIALDPDSMVLAALASLPRRIRGPVVHLPPYTRVNVETDRDIARSIESTFRLYLLNQMLGYSVNGTEWQNPTVTLNGTLVNTRDRAVLSLPMSDVYAGRVMYSLVGPRGYRVKQVESISVYTKDYLRRSIRSQPRPHARTARPDTATAIQR